MKTTLLENPLNREIITLLMLSSISNMEQRLWVALLPELTEKEKHELLGHVRKEVEHERAVEENALAQFIAALEKAV